ncbi:MAG: glycosyltransferase family 4 protein, partial [Pseudomonadota bacterium]
DLSEFTGAGRFGRGLVGHLAAADPSLEPVVLTSVATGHPWDRPVLPAGRLGVPAGVARIRRAMRACDLIHALDGHPYGTLAAVAAVGLPAPLVITAIGTGAVQPLYRRRGRLLAWAYRRASRVVAVSDYTRREILAKVPGLGIDVINHGVDAEEFTGDPWRGVEEANRRLIERARPYMLSVGAPKERKGLHYSIRAFAELGTGHPDLSYVVVGTGGRFIQPLVHGLGVGKRMVFLKNISRPTLVALYRHAEFFMLLPYAADHDVEGFGFVFLEAAAAGIPVIAASGSGAEDALEPGSNGFLVGPRDPSAAARAAEEILGSPGLRRRFSAGSLAFAKRMDWGRVVAQYRAIYDELTRG